MPNSVLHDLPTPLALVCHDAGAANLIFSWIRMSMATYPEEMRNWHLLLKGPAEKLWTGNFPTQIHLCRNIDELLDGVHMLVTGTGWASNLEYDALKIACQRNIPTIAVIDHWTNYRDRFIRNGIEVLPDTIWVTDVDAKIIAENEFNTVEVIQKPNVYLEKILQEINSNEFTDNDNILYLLEPVRDAWGNGKISGEFIALNYFINNLNILGASDKPSIRLRPHPSDSLGKYDQWINEQKHINISLDREIDLAKSIAWSNMVVGCQTYAMVIALAAGKKVFSSIPPWAPSCVLPQKGILKISELIQNKIAH